ncbi:MAG: UDP-3-O-(3-hydroxymyristoyl)glucosamine N-acyltransferase [Halanaerobiaceae bacterium]
MSNKTLRAQEVAEIVGGRLEGDPKLKITSACGLDESGPHTVTFAGSEEYLKKVAGSEAGLVIVPEGMDIEGKNLLFVDNPRLAYARISTFFVPEIFHSPGVDSRAVVAETARLGKDVSVHPGVIIEEGAVIGKNTILAPGVYIGKNVQIGEDCLLHPRVLVEYDSVLGDRVTVQAGTVIGSDGFGFASSEEGHYKIPQLGRVIIEDDVEVGACVTIDRGASGDTVVGRGTKTDNLIQIAHNVKIGEECLLVAQVGISGSSLLGDRVTLAGKVGLAGHLEVGAHTTIAAGSIVTKDIPSGVFYSGNPAQDHRKEMREKAARRKLPDLIKRVRELEKKVEELKKKGEEC